MSSRMAPMRPSIRTSRHSINGRSRSWSNTRASATRPPGSPAARPRCLRPRVPLGGDPPDEVVPADRASFATSPVGAVGAGLSTQAIADVVIAYAEPLGIEVAPHDCRRTFAKLALKGGARLEQIQLSLGHASIRTTERYLGVEQDLADAPCHRLS
ncbi:MAG: site-specific integrase [Chloroflexi bacterium]|nr:site-specific integrase [Chloroflexota bacterium]